MLVAWILLVVGLILIALTAVYVAAEFSLVTVDRVAVDAAAARGDKRASAVQSGLKRLSTQLSGAQVGITVTTLALGYVMEPSLAALLAGPLTTLGLDVEVASVVAVAIALAVATVLSMVFGELVPKNVAIAKPMAVARSVIAINTATTAVCKPLIAVLNGAANATVRLFGMEPKEELGGARSPQELESLVRRSGAHGSLESASARLVGRTLRFSAKQAFDVLTPRVDIVSVRAADTAQDVIDRAVRSGLSRFPVIGTDVDDIVGLVHVKRAVALPTDDRSRVTARELMVPAPRVPGTLTLDDLLPLLRRRGLQLAVVIDEYGGVEGVVTLEDVIEELLGDIADEHDRGGERWSRTLDGTVIVSGVMRPDEIGEFTGVRLPDANQYETVAGLITERLSRLPQLGDKVTLWAAVRSGVQLAGEGLLDASSHGGDLPRRVPVELTVAAMQGRRVLTVEIRFDPADGVGIDGTLATRDDDEEPLR